MKKTPFSTTAGIVFRFTRRRCYRALTVALAGLSCFAQLTTSKHRVDRPVVISNSYMMDVRDNSFLRNVENCAEEPWNLPVSAECLRLRRILHNSVLAGDRAANMAYFGRVHAERNYLGLILYIFRFRSIHCYATH